MTFDKSAAFAIIKESFDSLVRAGTIEKEIDLNEKTVVLGSGSPLDSIGFITFITELEDRIQAKTNEEHYLVLSDIGDFNVNSPSLTVSTLAEYLVKLIKNEGI